MRDAYGFSGQNDGIRSPPPDIGNGARQVIDMTAVAFAIWAPLRAQLAVKSQRQQEPQ
ncbi:hypothetical protein [Erwinia psidii]|uniref:hypothetical protein n=1 Tax=Erwinia psidii TaxID=69224 RepID=UPI0013153598|nr:hypothetical protein [Erwinia psidii]